VGDEAADLMCHVAFGSWQASAGSAVMFRLVAADPPLGEDGDSEFGDLIEDSEAIQPGEAVSFTLLQEQLHSVLDTLSEREAGVVSMRFGLTDGQPKTLDEIGKVYGVTRERIRQIESKTMSKLRHPSRSRILRDYLD
jgi:RNA polymerase primary sigma factor